MPRRVYVDMETVLDAMGTAEAEVRWVLDLRTGAVALAGQGDDEGGDDAEDELALVPRRGASDDLELMTAFAGSVEEAEVRAELVKALDGHEAAARFRGVLGRHPDLRARFEERRRDALLAAALAWLGSLDVEPQYELRPLAVPAPAPEPARAGVYDVLLLGTAVDAGDAVAVRQVRARSEAGARKLFEGLARELAEQGGVAWRRRLVEGRDAYAVGRAEVRVDGARVELRVEVPPEVRRLLARE